MTKVPGLPEIDALADEDYLYVVDASDLKDPDKKVPASKVRPKGSRIIRNARYADTIAIPAMAAASEQTVTVTIPGALPGDHVVFNLDAPPRTSW